MTSPSGGRIDTVMHETRVFPPSKQFASKARIGSPAAYEKLYAEAAADPVEFWAQMAREELHWSPSMAFEEGVAKSVEWLRTVA